LLKEDYTPFQPLLEYSQARKALFLKRYFDLLSRYSLKGFDLLQGFGRLRNIIHVFLLLRLSCYLSFLLLPVLRGPLPNTDGDFRLFPELLILVLLRYFRLVPRFLVFVPLRDFSLIPGFLRDTPLLPDYPFYLYLPL
jgi:hypothetical protein